MGDAETAELLHDRLLAERIARVRIALGVADFAVIWLDSTVPSHDTPQAYALANGAAGLLLAYALLGYALLRYQWVSLKCFLLSSPVFDVVFASLLVVSTSGYLSQFNLWFVFAVIASSFSRYRLLPFLTAGFGVAAHFLIAAIPQEEPLDLSRFAVRIGYLFGFAAVLSSAGLYLLRQSKMLAIMERMGQGLTRAVTEEEAGAALLDGAMDAFGPGAVRLRLSGGRLLKRGERPPRRTCRVAIHPIADGPDLHGALYLFRRTALPHNDRVYLGALCERTVSTLRRIRLARELVRAAAAERVRLADQLHDSYLQSLAALDLRVESALWLARRSGPQVVPELEAIRRIARDSAAQLREILGMRRAASRGGMAAIRQALAARWPGARQLDLDPTVGLSPGQWRAVEMLVCEGLNNVRKHAKASAISFKLRRDGGGVICALSNNGSRVPSVLQFGYGLTRLREEIERQHGRLRLQVGEPDHASLIAEFEVGL